MFFRRPCSTGWRGGGVGLSPPFKLSIVSRVSDKIRIRIRKKKMRIRNPDCIISVSRFIVCIYLSIFLSIYQSISLCPRCTLRSNTTVASATSRPRWSTACAATARTSIRRTRTMCPRMREGRAAADTWSPPQRSDWEPQQSQGISK